MHGPAKTGGCPHPITASPPYHGAAAELRLCMTSGLYARDLHFYFLDICFMYRTQTGILVSSQISLRHPWSELDPLLAAPAGSPSFMIQRRKCDLVANA